MKAVAIAIMLALVPAFMFAQGGVSEPAKTSVSCPDAECHVVPFFKGSGGFVGELDTSIMVDGEEITEATLVVTCGNITTSASAAPNADGKVVQLFTEANGLACDQDSGEISIHGLTDGGWYWIHDETNSAVSNLLPKDVLENTQTAPVDVSGGDITMTSRDYATLVKDTTSGRVGILPHILPEPPPAATTPTPKCEGGRRKGCLLTGDYEVDIEISAPSIIAGTKIAGFTFTRSTLASLTITASVTGTGIIKVDSTGEITADFVVTDLDGNSNVPNVYGGGVTGTDVASIDLPMPIFNSLAQRSTTDPCGESNQRRDVAIVVAITATNSGNTVPGFTDDGPSAAYAVRCPPLPGSAVGGVELIPDNLFPVD